MATRSWIGEQVDEDGEEGRVLLTGIFYVYVDSRDGQIDSPELVGWDAALDWAKSHADVVYVDVESDARYIAHGIDPAGDCQPLSAAIEAHLREGRRRPLVDRWLDRTRSDPPLGLGSGGDIGAGHHLRRVCCVGEQLASQVGLSLEGAGLEGVTWSSAGLAAFAQSVPSGQGDGVVSGWTASAEETGIKVVGRAMAPTYLPLTERAAELTKGVLDRANHRMPHAYREGEDTAAWDGRVVVQPPGYFPPFGSGYDGMGTVDVSPDWR